MVVLGASRLLITYTSGRISLSFAAIAWASAEQYRTRVIGKLRDRKKEMTEGRGRELKEVEWPGDPEGEMEENNEE